MKIIKMAFVVASIIFTFNVANAGGGHKEPVLIQKAILDFEESVLEIVGNGFDNGRYTRVWLADQRLEILSADRHRISAALPSGIEPADYLLIVKTGRGSKRTDRFNLTVPSTEEIAGQIVGYYTVYDDPQQIKIVAPGEMGSVRATCAPGDYAVSGTYIVGEASEVYSPDFRFRIASFSSGIDQTSPNKNQFWALGGYNESPPGMDAEIHVRVTCADVAD